MRKLSTLIKRENCFFTKDGQTLRTVQDLLEYLMNCDEETYAYHVNSQKNDFATWVNNVLLFPELGESLKISKSIAEARDALMEFFQVFDYRSKSITEDKAFHTIDDYKLKNVQELYYYINNCDDTSFQYHFNPKKNDFANWISDVLIFPELSAKMRAVPDKQSVVNVLKEFLLTSTEYGANPEYEKYINERLEHDDTKSSTEKNVANSANSNNLENSENKKIDVSQNLQSSKANTSEQSIQSISASSKDAKIEETIDMSKKYEYIRADDPEKAVEKSLDKNGFRQFTDEELEKFVAFTNIDKDKTTDADVKVEYLKSVLQELKNMVRDLRRAEKDPMVADLMLRNLDAKVTYYALSKNIDDYNHIIRLMKDVQVEIEDCSEKQSYNIAEEIFKDLRLQGIAMKKA